MPPPQGFDAKRFASEIIDVIKRPPDWYPMPEPRPEPPSGTATPDPELDRTARGLTEAERGEGVRAARLRRQGEEIAEPVERRIVEPLLVIPAAHLDRAEAREMVVMNWVSSSVKPPACKPGHQMDERDL